MHPELIKIGWFKLQSYGVLLAFSFLVGILFAAHRAKKRNIPQNFILDLSIIIAISSLLGARFLYVIFHLNEFRGHWLDSISPFQSSGEFGILGLTMLGGVLGAILASWIYVRVKGYNFLKIADIFSPSIALGLIFVRIGCFLYGCCYGIPADGSWWGIVFPLDCPAGAAFPDTPIYPTQLFSSFGGVIILGSLLLMEARTFPDGFTFFSFLVLYGMKRFLIDILRYYESSMVLFQFGSIRVSVNQGISLILITIGLIGIGILWQRQYKSRLDSHE